MCNAAARSFQAILVRLSFPNQTAIAVRGEKLLQAELSRNTEKASRYIISSK
jgi:hypothetical protein